MTRRARGLNGGRRTAKAALIGAPEWDEEFCVRDPVRRREPVALSVECWIAIIAPPPSQVVPARALAPYFTQSLAPPPSACSGRPSKSARVMKLITLATTVEP